MTIYITDADEYRKLKLYVDGQDFSKEFVDGGSETEVARADLEMEESEFWLWEERVAREQRILDTANELGETAIEAVIEAGLPYGADIEARQDAQERYLGIA